MVEISDDFSKCIGCRECVNVCDAGAIEIREKRVFRDQSKCSFCCECLEICPAMVFEV